MPARGVRGATICDRNTKEAIRASTGELLQALMAANGIKKEDVACAFLTTTRDLNAEFPAAGAREMGWVEVALLCGHEMDVPGALQGVIRVMLVVNSNKRPGEIKHVYLKGASQLRPQLSQDGGKA